MPGTACEAAGGTVIDVFDRRLVAQPGVAQPCPQPPIVALGGFAIEQEGKPFGMSEIGALWIGLQLGEGAPCRRARAGASGRVWGGSARSSLLNGNSGSRGC